MSYNWRLGGRRAPNDVLAHPQRIDATDGSTRYALGRNVKGDRQRVAGGVTYEIVEVWTLRHRVDGKVETVDTLRSREAAERWVRDGVR